MLDDIADVIAELVELVVSLSVDDSVTAVVAVDETLEDVSVEIVDVVEELVELVVSVNVEVVQDVVEVVEDVVAAVVGLIVIDHFVASSVPKISGCSVTPWVRASVNCRVCSVGPDTSISSLTSVMAKFPPDAVADSR